ncbi:HhH-GPD-type base excision DNA repair protein [Microlunatus sp. Gsoil 973]|uniref:HhH-GPD-type base excision DNA repair protein n=1 Tax=Microlunatus sp. Gsoil 973 TaxID=2672569 RepID=UPI0012B4E79B|nr:HhH-GPD-type base excision DNA repair protein [Microlunatus sp. Gsoil 973]QGN32483.1 Fe-S cluster assembly protein HesB [Microlunatus sp. Gsoil 973]
MSAPELHLTGNDDADRLLSENPSALLIGMTLDQQVPMEKAFSGPAVIAERMGGAFDVAKIAAMDVDDFVAICSERPAIHRFPGAMGKRVHAVCRALVEEYDGDAANLWADVTDGAELKKRVAALPGFGDQKASIFVALLGKQRGVTPMGWREAAGRYGDDGVFRSVADIVDPSSLSKVRQTKKEEKAKARG